MGAIQNIFREHADEYIQRFGDKMPHSHRKTINAICECRSGARGHHIFRCPECDETHVANSSCGNRHCPECQNDKSAEWVYKQQLRLLPCNYFLSTFTLPSELRAVSRSHQAKVYSVLFECAAESLKTLEADKRYIGCKVAGFFGVLHTWGRQMQYHPHVHIIVPGGGLNKSRDKWRPSSADFLVHVRALSRMFRGKVKARFRELNLFSHVDPRVWQKEWVVHCKAVGDGRLTIKYLGAYVFRVAISNSRIVSYDGEKVTFKYKKSGSSRWRRMTLDVMEFMRRYLQHVLPRNFMKVRHFGFMSPNFGLAIQKIRELISLLYELLRNNPVKAKPPKKPRPLQCANCHSVMKWVQFIAPPKRAFSP